MVWPLAGGNLETADADLEIEYRGSRVSLSCPVTQTGAWWHVFDWDSRSEELRVVGTLGDEALLV